MSLVSCIMADMQYTMATSDAEDKAAQISARLKNVTEQGADLGKTIAGIDSQIDQAKTSSRELQIYQMQAGYSQNPQAQQALGMVQQRKAYCSQAFNSLQQRKIQLEAESKKFKAQEKELTAEQTKNDVMKKRTEGLAQKFKGFADGAIKRFVGGGGQ